MMMGKQEYAKKGVKSDCCRIKGVVVLMKKKVLDVNCVFSNVVSRFDELVGHGVSFQLVSSIHGDNEKGGRLGKQAYLEDWITKFNPLTADDIEFSITFDWDESLGLPGAVIVKNNHHVEFCLKTFTLEHVPHYGKVHFDCNSWVYPASKYNYDRVFFTNKTYLPSETPLTLRKYRANELVILRGNGNGELQAWDRVYDYAYYNDLGNPDKGTNYARPVLGGSLQYPYPRRGRTGRAPTKNDPKSESRLPPSKSLEIYVPRDEQFNHIKLSDVLAYGLKGLYQVSFPELKGLVTGSPKEFTSFKQVLSVYDGSISLPTIPFFEKLKDNIPFEVVRELFRSDGEQLFKFPMPQVIQEDKSAWRTDEEFGREMLAGINPVVIRCLKEFPPRSKLDKTVYGDQNSASTYEHIKHSLNGLTIEEAIDAKKLFILDHHDDIMPFLRRINSTSNKAYATRTLIFLNDDETLKPVAIELSLPHPKGNEFGAVSKVYTPATKGIEGSIWELAKAYVLVNDSGYHQLISHWLQTHATMEPIVIATNRQLSVIHPIYKLLHPHFRDTMNVNALAREILVCASGALQYTLFPGKYAMELSSELYKNWVFPEQALPVDLIKRGMAIEDANSRYGIRLIIEDYPYAVDGLEIWFAIKTWVEDYCTFYYKTDETVKTDTELQSWWHEVRTVGHGDLKDKPWWPKMETIASLIESCTTIIWIASAYHAAINFGQYPYGGYLPNRPSISRKFMPEPGTPDYKELETNPEKAYFKTITAKQQILVGISVIEVLSRHTADEIYLGQRETEEWTADTEVLEAFQRFGKKLEEIERKIGEMNKDENLKNRNGLVKMPYTSLMPSSDVGLTGRGIPNSVTI